MAQTSNLGLYSPAFVQINGNTLFEEVSVSVDRTSGNQEVVTVPKGFAGVSLGASKTEITIESAVPLAGFENPGPTPLDQQMGALAIVSFNVQTASQNLTFNGFIMSIANSHAAGSPAKVTYKAVGSFSVFQ